MSTAEQIDDLYRFAKALPQEELDALSIDEVYDRWRGDALREEDIEAIRESYADFQNGERGVPAKESMAQLRNELRGLAGG